MTKVLLTINDAPYGTERAYNALRLGAIILKQAPKTELRVFLVADADPAVSGTKRVFTFSQNFRINEIKVTVSSGFDTVSHVPTGTIETTSIAAESWQRGSGSYPFYSANDVGNGNKTGQYWMWVDANGVSLFVTWLSRSLYDYTIFFDLERNTTKEYADGFTNFFLVALTNDDREIYYSSGSTYRMNVYEGVSGTFDHDLNRKEYIRLFNTSTTAYESGIETVFDGYKSAGNSKVYVQFPYYPNNLDASRRTPIAQTNSGERHSSGVSLR